MRPHYLHQIILFPSGLDLILSAPQVFKWCAAIIRLWSSSSECQSGLLLTQLENILYLLQPRAARKWSIKFMFVHASLHTKAEPTKWDGKTIIKGFVSHRLIPANVVCHLCLHRSVTRQTCNAASSAAAPPVAAFSVTDPVSLPLHRTKSASQHPVYWHDLKGSLTVGQCLVEQAPQHSSHTTQQLWLQNWLLVSVSMILTQVANHEQVVLHIVSLSETNNI